MSALAITYEAAADDARSANARASRAADEVLRDNLRLERQIAERVYAQLRDLQRALISRLLSGTLHEQRHVAALATDVDRLVADAYEKLARFTRTVMTSAADLGDSYVEHPLTAARLPVNRSIVGLDATLVRSAYDNAVELLTAPMQQFANSVKTSLRRVTLAGDSRMGEIQRMTRLIEKQGIPAAAYKAERIIRTEQGRVFGEATYARLNRLGTTFPTTVLSKCWRATVDNRTRKGHREAGARYVRGRGIPIADLFEVNVYQELPGTAPTLLGVVRLRYPIDSQASPAGRLAAACTIMCRCNMVLDINTASYSDFIRSRVATAFRSVERPPPPLAPALPAAPEPASPATPVGAPILPVRVRLPRAGQVTASSRPLQSQSQNVVRRTRRASNTRKDR